MEVYLFVLRSRHNGATDPWVFCIDIVESAQCIPISEKLIYEFQDACFINFSKYYK